MLLPIFIYQDALAQCGIATLSQRRKETCVNFIKREGSSLPLPSALVPYASILIKKDHTVLGLAEAC